MRSAGLKRSFSVLLAVLAIALVAAPSAGATEQTVVELPSATHAGSVVAGDGSVWFTLSHGESWEGPTGPAIGHLAADGTVAEVPTPIEGRLALGPAGELWVAGSQGSDYRTARLYVDELSESGQAVHQYPVGEGEGRFPALAATGGAVWFSRSRYHGRSEVERLDRGDGSVQRFVLRPRCKARALVVAADETAWFTESCPSHTSFGRSAKTSRIGWIEPDGKVVRYHLTGKGFPVSIALGSDGSVWFGMSDSGYTAPMIGRVTGSGVVTQYRVPNAEPRSIAVGPEGNLWFPSSFGGHVYRALGAITPSGHVLPPICADPTCSLGAASIASAPDGSLWYALSELHSIGGGGFTQIMEGESIGNSAGQLGHLVP